MARRRSRSRSRKSRRRSTNSDKTNLIVFATIAGIVALYLFVQWLGRHPAVIVALGAVTVLVVGAGCWAYRTVVDQRRQRERELTASVAATDGLTGPQFEHWVALLMRRTGFLKVEVCGGSGDLGADIVAVTFEGQRIVVQCKCWRADRAVGSPDIQKFAGTARALHRADVAVVVTTARFSQPAISTAERLGITLVDRQSLACWASDGNVPWQ